MDPITMLLTALAAGAAAAAQDTASEAVKDAYTALKERVQEHFAGNHQAEVALHGYEHDAETWHLPLQKALEATSVHSDESLLQDAQQLLQQVQPQQIAKGKFNTQIGTSYGTVIGEHNTINQQFDKK